MNLTFSDCVFKNQAHLYAIHIHHQKAVPVDQPVGLNLNQSEQQEFILCYLQGHDTICFIIT
jgi:hypothetical protein